MASLILVTRSSEPSSTMQACTGNVPRSPAISEPMLKRGFQFAPGYRLQEFLGRGQFGQVWRATAPGGAATAAKFIDLSDGQGQKEYEGVKRVKQIRHANLMPITAIWLLDAQGKVIEEAPDEAVQTLDLSVQEAAGQSAIYHAPGVEPSWLVVAMLLGGKSLQQRLRECVEEGLPGIPPKELISYMDESAKGIDFLNAPQHDLGEGPIAIQHSDIKPANIVLIGSSAVVCDFGLARILSRNQVTATSAAGTPAYMAPEAISGKPSRTSDQYSLAVTYYHLRTGSLPVNDGSLWEVLDAHRLGKLKLGLVPAAEQEVLRKATDLKWENRFDSNVEMVDALREALRVEGHTKPGFELKSVGANLAGSDTKNVEGDPTATLDVPLGQSSSDDSVEATAPFVAAEKSTKEEGFLKETLPELRETPPPSQSPAEWVKRNPKLLACVAGGIVVMLLGAVVMRPDPVPSPPPDQNGGIVVDNGNGGNSGNGGSGNGTPETVPGDPQEMVREAIALLDSDESAAMAKFKSALALDPGLSPSATQWPGHQGAIMKTAKSSASPYLVSMADGPSAFLWNLESSVPSEPILLPGHDKLINTFVIGPDGERLVTGGLDDIARVWNLSSSDPAGSSLELKGHQGEIKSAAWHPTKPIVVTSSSDMNLGIWELGLATDESPNGTISKDRRVPVQESLTVLVSDTNGKWLAARTVGDDLVDPKIDVLVFSWDELIQSEGAPTPRRLGTPNVKHVAFLAGDDESLLAVAEVGGTITLHSVTDGFQTRVDAHKLDIDAMKVVPAGGRNFVATGSEDGSVHWWNYGNTSERRSRSFSPEWGIGCVDVSTDGRWVAAGANDGTLWLWDTTQGDEKSGAIRFVSGAVSVDSILIDSTTDLLIAGCADGVLRTWDLTYAKLMALTHPTLPGATIEGPTIEMESIPIAAR